MAEGEGLAGDRLCPGNGSLSPSPANQLRPADPDEPKTPAAVHAAAADLPASRYESCADVEASPSQFNDESLQLSADRFERNVSVCRWGNAPASPAACPISNEWQKSRTIPREINVILH